MEEVVLPFVPPRPAVAAAAPAPDEVARQAAARAAEVEARLARPRSAPVHFAGRTPLPFLSPLQDPARVTGAHSRIMRQFRPRVQKCVACEYGKLDTRLAEAAVADAAALSADQARHVGVGERSYDLCKSCHDTFGTVHPGFYKLWVAQRPREDSQRSLKDSPDFQQIADRVAAVDRWRRAALQAREFGEALTPPDRTGEEIHVRRRKRQRESSPDDEEFPLDRGRDNGPYDGFPLDGAMRLSEFTDQSAPASPRRFPAGRAAYREVREEPPEPGAERTAGRSRRGDPDPLWRSNDAEYDYDRIGADHAAAVIEDERWDARRVRSFSRAFRRLEYIEDPEKREAARERLFRRWDARISPQTSEPERGLVASPFAEVTRSLAPYPGRARHSGVDEAFDAEPGYVRAAHARHLAAVADFLREARGKLAAQGMDPARIAELTTLPPLEPEPIRRYPLDPPLRVRLREAREFRLQLPPASELDQAAADGAVYRWARDTVGELEATRPDLHPNDVIDLAGRVHARAELEAAVAEAEAAREHVSTWANAIHRAERDLERAANRFAQEIKTSFVAPKAFGAAFKRLTGEQKRAMLEILRERPQDFAREFSTAFGHEFGTAGELATGRRQVPEGSPVGEIERSGIQTAEAGRAYLDAATHWGVVRRRAAREFGLSDRATTDDLKKACRARMAEARQKKSAAIREQDGLGDPPTARELAAAFSGLSQEDRRRVLREVPGLTQLIDIRGRALAKSGPSL